MQNKSERVIGTELHALSNRICRFFANSQGRKALDSVSGKNGWIIAYLANNAERDIFQKDIEKEFDLTGSTVSKVISLMEQKGLIERRRVPQDARLKKLTLTEKSEPLARLVATDKQNLEKVLTKGFTPEEKDVLIEYLTRMRNNLENESK